MTTESNENTLFDKLSNVALFGFPVIAIGAIVSSPFAYYILKHTEILEKNRIYTNALLGPNTKIFRGPLKSIQKPVITRTVVSKFVEQGSEKRIIKRQIREYFNIRRFEGMEYVNKCDDDSRDTSSPHFRYWIDDWDKVETVDNGEKVLEISSLYPDSQNEYTIAYIPKHDFVEYLGICEGGDPKCIERKLSREMFTSSFIVGANSYVLGHMWYLFLFS